jgi:hypothetical protein
MADLTKDSFSETNLFTKVLFQRDKDVVDFELNELQDNERVSRYRTNYAGLQAGSAINGNTPLNPGSGDDGFLAVGTSLANSLTLKAGWLLCDGIPIPLWVDTVLSGFSTPGSNRTDTVYVAVSEVEVTNPAQIPKLGETTRRRQIQFVFGISTTGHAGVPASSPTPVWFGGIHYYMIADVARHAGSATIHSYDVTDLRFPLPSEFTSQVVTSGLLSTQATNLSLSTDTIRSTGAAAITLDGSTAGKDDSVRFYDVTISPQPSILKALNGRAYLTVGDGTNSAGDFSSPTAINDAIVSASLTSSSLHLVVKRGNYEFAGSTDLSSFTDVIIEGEVPQSVHIGVDSGNTTFINTSQNKLVFKNLTFTAPQVLTPGTQALNISSAKLELENVNFIGCYSVFTNLSNSTPYGFSVLSNRSALNCKNCSWSDPNALIGDGGHEFVRLVFGGTDSGYFEGYNFNNCFFSTRLDQPSVTIAPTGLLSSAISVKKVKFKDCEFTGCGSSTTGNYLTKNGGVLCLDPNGDTTASLSIDSVEWEDCVINGGNTATAPKNTVFFHVIPSDNNATYVAGHALVNLNKVALRNCQLNNMRNSSTPVDYNPLTIYAQSVELDNVTVNWQFSGSSHSNHGQKTFSAASWIEDTDSNGWALVAIRGTSKVRIDNLRLTNLTRVCNNSNTTTTGDLFIVCPDDTYINGVLLDQYFISAIGAQLPPYWRVQFRSSDFSSANRDISNVRMVGSASPGPTAYWCQTGGGDGFGMILAHSSTALGTISNFYFRNISIKGFQDISAGKILASGLVLGGTINNVVVDNFTTDCASYGIMHISSGYSPGEGERLSIRNCFITGSSTGILIQNDCLGLVIDDNYIKNCSGPGIVVQMNWIGFGSFPNDDRSVVVSNNRVYNCSGSSSGNAIVFVGGANVYPSGTCIGNSCAASSGLVGTIKISQNNLAIASPSYMSGVAMAGVETSWNSANPQKYEYTNGAYMVHNRATLETP